MVILIGFAYGGKKKKSSNSLISCISLIHLEREKDRLTTCRTLLIHWKLSSSEASGRCSATSTIRSSCNTGTENTAILKHKGQKNERMQHGLNRAWLIITWQWLQPLMALSHTHKHYSCQIITKSQKDLEHVWDPCCDCFLLGVRWVCSHPCSTCLIVPYM